MRSLWVELPAHSNSTALHLDAALSSFADQSTQAHSLGSMTLAGMVGRISRLGFLSSGVAKLLGPSAQHFASHVFSLGIEAAAFESFNRVLSPFHNPESFQQNWIAHFINFSTFRLVGSLGASPSALAQHFTQSFAMVAGHQVAGALGVEEKPKGSFSEQMLQASVSTLQIQVGSFFASLASGGALHHLEKNWERHSSLMQNSTRLSQQVVPIFLSEETIHLGDARLEAILPMLAELQAGPPIARRFSYPPDLPARILDWGNEQFAHYRSFAQRILELHDEAIRRNLREDYLARVEVLERELNESIDVFSAKRKTLEWFAKQCIGQNGLDRCSLGLVIQHHFINVLTGIRSTLSSCLDDLSSRRPLSTHEVMGLHHFEPSDANSAATEAILLAEDTFQARSSKASNFGFKASQENFIFNRVEDYPSFRRGIELSLSFSAEHAAQSALEGLRLPELSLNAQSDAGLEVKLSFETEKFIDRSRLETSPHLANLRRVLEENAWGLLEIEQNTADKIEIRWDVPAAVFETIPRCNLQNLIEQESTYRLSVLEAAAPPPSLSRERIIPARYERAQIPYSSGKAHTIVVRSLAQENLQRNLPGSFIREAQRFYRGVSAASAAAEDLPLPTRLVEQAHTFYQENKDSIPASDRERFERIFSRYCMEASREFTRNWQSALTAAGEGGRLFFMDLAPSDLKNAGESAVVPARRNKEVVEIVHEAITEYPRPPIADFAKTEALLPWLNAAGYLKMEAAALARGSMQASSFHLINLEAQIPHRTFYEVKIFYDAEAQSWNVFFPSHGPHYLQGEKIYHSSSANELGEEIPRNTNREIKVNDYLHLVNEETGVFVSVRVREEPCRPHIAKRFWKQHEAEVEARIEAFLQHFSHLKDPAATRQKLQRMEKSFCTSLCDRLERISTQHGLGNKPVILFDVDETILQRISKKDYIRPSLALMLSFLRAEFPGLKFGIATSRHSSWQQMEEGCYRQAGWQEVEVFFERDLLFTLSEDRRNTYEGRPTPLNKASSWDDARRKRFYNEDFAALVANYLAHEQVLDDAIRERVKRSAESEGRKPMDWELADPFHFEEARESLYLRLGLSAERPLRDLPLETLLFDLSSRLCDQNQFEETETMPNIEYPHEALRRSFRAEIPSHIELDARKRENQSLSSITESDTRDFERFSLAQTGEEAHSFNLTKVSAGRVLLDQNRASCCIVMDGAFPHKLFDLFDAAGDSEPNPYTLLGIRRLQHRLWIMNAGEEGYFSIY